MIESIIVGVAFFVAQFVYSVIGFAGTLILLAIGSIVIDIKLLLMIDLPIAIIGSLVLVYKLSQHIDYTVLGSILLPSLFGVIFGNVFFHYADSNILLKFFALTVLIVFIMDGLNFKFSNKNEMILLVFSGFFQGIIGLGLLAIAITKHKFSSKKSFLATFALYFVVLNIVRLLQFSVQGDFVLGQVLEYWWVLLVIFISLIFGSIFRSSVNYFRCKGITYIFLVTVCMYYLIKF